MGVVRTNGDGDDDESGPLLSSLRQIVGFAFVVDLSLGLGFWVWEREGDVNNGEMAASMGLLFSLLASRFPLRCNDELALSGTQIFFCWFTRLQSLICFI